MRLLEHGGEAEAPLWTTETEQALTGRVRGRASLFSHHPPPRMAQGHPERAPGACGFSSGKKRSPRWISTFPALWATPWKAHVGLTPWGSQGSCRVGHWQSHWDREVGRAYSNQHWDLGRPSFSSQWRKRLQPVALPNCRAKLVTTCSQNIGCMVLPDLVSREAVLVLGPGLLHAWAGKQAHIALPTAELSPPSRLVRRHKQNTQEAE